MVKRMEYCRWEMIHHCEPGQLELPFTEAQFLQRVSNLADAWETSSREMAENVATILTNTGGKVGRFSW